MRGSHGFIDVGCSKANTKHNGNAVGPPQHFFYRLVFRLEARADIDAAARQKDQNKDDGDHGSLLAALPLLVIVDSTVASEESVLGKPRTYIPEGAGE